MSKCKISGCNQSCTYSEINRKKPTTWWEGESKGSPNGSPHHSVIMSDLCYFHLKQKAGYYDSKQYIGKLSGPAVISRSGRTRDLHSDSIYGISLSNRRSHTAGFPVHLGGISI